MQEEAKTKCCKKKSKSKKKDKRNSSFFFLLLEGFEVSDDLYLALDTYSMRLCADLPYAKISEGKSQGVDSSWANRITGAGIIPPKEYVTCTTSGAFRNKKVIESLLPDDYAAYPNKKKVFHAYEQEEEQKVASYSCINTYKGKTFTTILCPQLIANHINTIFIKLVVAALVV